MQLTVLDPEKPWQSFPPANKALTAPDGLLAIGGCLSTQRLLNAYRHGIFPWNSPDEPLLWWSPDPRLVLFPEQMTVTRSLIKTIRKQKFTVTFDRAFGEVVKACASPRKEGAGTWITEDILQAYTGLHQSGYAHSVEAWHNQTLAGGVYGVAIGRVFFGESMFFYETDASKVAFVTLVRHLADWGYKLIDCQVSTGHLKSFGAQEILRADFESLLNEYCDDPPEATAWQVR